MNDIEILNTAIKVYGDIAQEQMAIEECCELAQAICHKHRGRTSNISEEIADVEIMLEQLKIINNCHSDVEHIKKAKLLRLYDRLFDKCL